MSAEPGDNKDVVKFEVKDGIAWVFFNSPEKRNAMYMTLTGDVIDGITAEWWRLVNESVPPA